MTDATTPSSALADTAGPATTPANDAERTVHRDAVLSDDAAALFGRRGVGALAEKMGIEIVEMSAERAVGRMPVEGNTQPVGILHGGAHVVLAETLGSVAANVHAGAGRLAMGIELNASHSRSATTGWVTGTCTAVHLGRTLATHQVVMTDDEGRLLSTVRITNYLTDARG
jgi:1,4-dihydroxy-2-naphthoyl-CoA hydrolase